MLNKTFVPLTGINFMPNEFTKGCSRVAEMLFESVVGLVWAVIGWTGGWPACCPVDFCCPLLHPAMPTMARTATIVIANTDLLSGLDASTRLFILNVSPETSLNPEPARTHTLTGC